MEPIYGCGSSAPSSHAGPGTGASAGSELMIQSRRRPKKRKSIPILSEHDVEVASELIRSALGSTLAAKSDAPGVDLADTLRYSALARQLITARESRGLSLSVAAASLKVPQYRLRAIEAGSMSEIEPDLLERYVKFLEEDRWFVRWKKAHPVLASRLAGTPAPPAPPWTGRLVEFEEVPAARSGGAPSRRTTSVLDKARSRYRQAYRLRVELNDTRRPIWRLLVVPEGITLQGLHLVLQEVMGWTNTHLYELTSGGATFAEPDEDDADLGRFVHDSRVVLLGDLRLGRGSALRYLYDFGDGWEHIITVEEISPPDKRQPVPACLDGRRACPPEDVGGIGGYENMLRALADAGHEEHESFKQWLGRRFDPEAFDPELVNLMLKREQAVWRRRLAKPVRAAGRRR